MLRVQHELLPKNHVTQPFQNGTISALNDTISCWRIGQYYVLRNSKHTRDAIDYAVNEFSSSVRTQR